MGSTVLVAKSLEEEIQLFKKLSVSKSVSGLIISRTLWDDKRFKLLKDLKHLVAHGRLKVAYSAWLDIDNEAAFYDMTNHHIFRT